MRHARLYADSTGETQFEQATIQLNEADYRPPAPIAYVSHSYQPGGLQFVRLPAGWQGQGIVPPQRQFLICLRGEIEMTATSGDKRSFGPGGIVLMEDTSGKGHRSRVKGSEECVLAVVPVV